MHTWKRAQNMEVIALEEGARIGYLDDFQFDLADHRVYGWRLKGMGVFARSGGVAAADLVLIGRDVAFVRSEAAIEWSKAPRNSEPGRAWASDYRGVKAISRNGREVGVVQDFVIDDKGARIEAILLRGNLLLPLEGRVQTGPAAVVAESESVAVEIPVEPDDERGLWGWVKDSLAKKKTDLPAPEPERPKLEGGSGD